MGEGWQRTVHGVSVCRKENGSAEITLISTFLRRGEVTGVSGRARFVAMGTDQELSEMAQLEKSEHLYGSSSSLVFTFFCFHCLPCPLQDVVPREPSLSDDVS